MPRLIRGDNLNDAQRRLVLAAFVHRHTHENAKQTYRGQCPACAQAGRKGWPYVCGEALPDGPRVYTREQWHAYHAPLTTDAEWLASYSFWFTSDGKRLSESHNHCEPIGCMVAEEK